MAQRQNRPIRIAGASGSVSDRRHALASFAKKYESDPVDVIIADYMSEANMVSAAARKVAASTSASTDSNPLAAIGPAFEASFIEALEPALPDLAKYGIKVAVNAGASDTKGLHGEVVKLIEKHGFARKVMTAWISGDEVLPQLKATISSDSSQLTNVYTSQTLADWGKNYKPIYAQAYLGGFGIAKAFSEGAQIVICGRVSDASPVIGAAVWWHGWARYSLDCLANALIAGHLIECSTYVTGGNFSGFSELEGQGWDDLGFPVAEISGNGEVIITKQKGKQGVVSVETCTAQLLYEIQGPWYFNSDVTAVITNINFEHLSTNRIVLRGVKGAAPPSTTKVGVTAQGGFQAELSWFLVGLDIPSKARMLESQLRKQLAPYSSVYSHLSFSLLGSAAPDARSQNAATSTFRIFAQARTQDDLATQKFLRPILDNIMQGYPGATFHLDFRQGLPKPYYEYFVTLLPQSALDHRVHLGWASPEKSIPIAPPAMSQTKTYPARQPSSNATATPADLGSFGPTQRLPLGLIAHARSGDKGPDCNVGFFLPALSPSDAYAWLRTLLSTEKIIDLLGDEYVNAASRISIERTEFPGLNAVHFLFRNLLDRGVTSTSSVDFLGKNVAEFLRGRYVDVPEKVLGGQGKI